MLDKFLAMARADAAQKERMFVCTTFRQAHALVSGTNKPDRAMTRAALTEDGDCAAIEPAALSPAAATLPKVPERRLSSPEEGTTGRPGKKGSVQSRAKAVSEPPDAKEGGAEPSEPRGAKDGPPEPPRQMAVLRAEITRLTAANAHLLSGEALGAARIRELESLLSEKDVELAGLRQKVSRLEKAQAPPWSGSEASAARPATRAAAKGASARPCRDAKDKEVRGGGLLPADSPRSPLTPVLAGYTRFLLAHPRSTISAIQEGLGVQFPTKTLHKLIASGKVVRERFKKQYLYTAVTERIPGN